jgi:osmotically inducible lipoprotein OsmB
MPPDIVAAVAPALAGSDRWLPTPGLGPLGKSTLHRSMKTHASGELFTSRVEGLNAAARWRSSVIPGTADAAAPFDRPMFPEWRITVRKTLNLLVAASALASLAACGHTVEEKAATGAVGGAVIGGPIGAAVGGAAGAVVGEAEKR